MDGHRRVASEQGGERDRDLVLFTAKVLIVALIGVLLFLAWRVAEALLLVFAGVLLSILFLRLVRGVRSWTGLGHGGALAVVLLVGVALSAGAGIFLGATLAGQFDQLSGLVRGALDTLPAPVRERLAAAEAGSSWLSGLRSLAGGVAWFLGNVVVVAFAGIYLAASPGVYRSGLVLLVPPARRDRAREVLHTTGEALWKWMIGQFASMLTVGVLTTLMLTLLDIPAALALGVMAFSLEFIPFLGPILAAAPAVLIAFSESPTTALWVIGGYVLIQQIEGNLILPLAQQKAVDLPPVVTIGAVVAGGLLFGVLGMFLAAPIAVVVLVLVNELYVRDRLGQRPAFPG